MGRDDGQDAATGVGRLVPTTDTDWNAYTLADDPMFGEVMRNRDLCRRAVELALDMPIDRIEFRHRQFAVQPRPDAPGIRLDVYAGDGSGRVFDVEMQKVGKGNLARRARYYHAGISFELAEEARRRAAERGERLSWRERYDALADAYVIFICLFDPIGAGRQRYVFRSLCVDDPSVELGDGATVVVLNAACEGGPGPLSNFLAYVAGRYDGDDDGYVRALDAEVRRVRTRADWRMATMHWTEYVEMAEDEARERGREQGIRQGREQGRREGESARAARLAALRDRLLAAGRGAELADALGDLALQDRLLAEFGV